MRHPDEMDECVTAADRLRVGIFRQRIGDNGQDLSRQFPFRTRADHRFHNMTPLCQQRNQPAADIARTAGDADRSHPLIPQRPDLTGHFDDDRVAFESFGNCAFGFRRFLREHDFQARRLSIVEHRDINSDHSRQRQQFLIVRAQDVVYVASRSS